MKSFNHFMKDLKLEVPSEYFYKAFNNVWHKGLVFKLSQNGISGNLLDILSILFYYFEKFLFKNSFFPSTILQWYKVDVILRKYDSFIVFKKEIVRFIQPSFNSFYNYHNPINIKYITRIRIWSKSLARV